MNLQNQVLEFHQLGHIDLSSTKKISAFCLDFEKHIKCILGYVCGQKSLKIQLTGRKVCQDLQANDATVS